MRSPITALTWEIWHRHQKSVWLVVGLILFARLFELVLPGSVRASETGRDMAGAVHGVLMVISLLVVFGIFNFTESTAGKEWTGFPYRLFLLPVPSWLLVGLPVVLGVICLDLVYAAWANLIFIHGEIDKPWWFAVLLGAYMVLYQTGLWCFAGFRISRIICLGFGGLLFVFIGCLPFMEDISPTWLSRRFLSFVLAGLALTAFGCAWFFVARQRCGGGRRQRWLGTLVDRITDALPRRANGFSSPGQAQFWFEWRRTGLLLPACVGLLLVLFIAPLSWFFRNGSLWILAWTLAMPMILAVPLGKGFSKPDFWSGDLSLPPFVAIRPLTAGEMVAIKLKVAARTAVISWLLVLAFLALWLPLWANLDALSMVRIGFWMAYGHSVYPQYAIAALFLVAGLLLTWKFLAGGLWIGLSGNRKLFIGSAVAYCLVPILGMIGLTLLLNHKVAVREWVREDPNRLLSFVVWTAALLVIAKFWMAARFWSHTTMRRIGHYLSFWLGGTLCLIVLAVLLWAGGLLDLVLMALLDFLPLDIYRLRNLLILVALLAIPLARSGLAPASLARNRHGGRSAK